MVMFEILKEEIKKAEVEMKKLEENKSNSAIIRKFQRIKYSNLYQRKKMLEQKLMMEEIKSCPKNAYKVHDTEYTEELAKTNDGVYFTPNVKKICAFKNKKCDKEGLFTLEKMKYVSVSSDIINNEDVLVARATKYGRLCLIIEGKKEETKGFER